MKRGQGSSTIADTLKRWEREGAEIEQGLRQRRKQLLVELAIVDQALERFGERRAEGDGRVDVKPGRRVVKAKVRATGPNTAEAVIDETATELEELRPFWFVLRPKTRDVVEMRAAGKPTAAIASKAGIANAAVSGRVFAARARLRAARQAGEKPEDADGSDDEEPDGARYIYPPQSPESGEVYIPAASTESPRTAGLSPPPGDVGPPAAGGSRASIEEPKQEPAAVIPPPTTDGERSEARKIIPKDIPPAPAIRRAAQLSPAASTKSASFVSPPTIRQPVRRLSAGRSPVAAHATAPANDVADEDLEGFDTPLVRIRRRVHTGPDGRIRAKTIAPSRLKRGEVKLGELLVHPAGVERPVVRGDCEEDPGRPCPWVSCPHHLYLDVNPETGAIKLNFPHLEVWEMRESCSLDVADRGGITLEEVGAIANLTRERIRQIEVRGLTKIKNHTGGELGLPPEPARGNVPL